VLLWANRSRPTYKKLSFGMKSSTNEMRSALRRLHTTNGYGQCGGCGKFLGYCKKINSGTDGQRRELRSPH